MSHDHINTAREAGRLLKLSSAARLVWMDLASRMNEHGEWSISNPDLVKDTGLGITSVKGALAELDRYMPAGWREHRPGLKNRFRLPTSPDQLSTTRPPHGRVADADQAATRPTQAATRPGVGRHTAYITERTEKQTDAPRAPFEILARCPNRTGWKNFCDESCERCGGSGHVHTDAVRPQTASSTRRFRRRA